MKPNGVKRLVGEDKTSPTIRLRSGEVGLNDCSAKVFGLLPQIEGAVETFVIAVRNFPFT
jgi:hypothetical protein